MICFVICAVFLSSGLIFVISLMIFPFSSLVVTISSKFAFSTSKILCCVLLSFILSFVLFIVLSYILSFVLLSRPKNFKKSSNIHILKICAKHLLFSAHNIYLAKRQTH